MNPSIPQSSPLREPQKPPAGILLSNLGTPDSPTPQALRRFLKEFLWDPRVVEAPRPLWWLILNGIILNTRPRRSARLYERIWTPEGSPLLAISRRQARALEEELRRRLNPPPPVALGMRYGRPSIAEALEALRAQECRRILVFPLYPQYSASTAGSTFDAVADTLKGWRWIPELRMINHYCDEPAYLATLAESAREVWRREGEPDRLMISFHGLPKRYSLAGDPYEDQCHRTAHGLAEALKLPPERWQLTFQSRFGREEWLQPYTGLTLAQWGASGVKKADVMCPGFPTDCLETLEEIAMTNREIFLRAGGAQFRYLPALNERPDHIRLLADIVQRELAGWAKSNAECGARSSA